MALLDNQINFLSFFDLHLLCLLFFGDDDLFLSADAFLVGHDIVVVELLAGVAAAAWGKHLIRLVLVRVGVVGRCCHLLNAAGASASARIVLLLISVHHHLGCVLVHGVLLVMRVVISIETPIAVVVVNDGVLSLGQVAGLDLAGGTTASNTLGSTRCSLFSLRCDIPASLLDRLWLLLLDLLLLLFLLRSGILISRNFCCSGLFHLSGGLLLGGLGLLSGHLLFLLLLLLVQVDVVVRDVIDNAQALCGL